jgi:predicted HicB family RNase H-like nuclease
MLGYAGFIGEVDFDENARTFYGKVVNANVLISFRGRTVDELEQSFHDVVDTYLEDCRQEGRAPERPYSGKITVRVEPTVHKRVAIKAASCKKSMNEYLRSLIEKDTADLASECP